MNTNVFVVMMRFSDGDKWIPMEVYVHRSSAESYVAGQFARATFEGISDALVYKVVEYTLAVPGSL
jgi:hypothetical protein